MKIKTDIELEPGCWASDNMGSEMKYTGKNKVKSQRKMKLRPMQQLKSPKIWKEQEDKESMWTFNEKVLN